jgi:hypothetical protein
VPDQVWRSNQAWSEHCLVHGETFAPPTFAKLVSRVRKAGKLLFLIRLAHGAAGFLTSGKKDEVEINYMLFQ